MGTAAAGTILVAGLSDRAYGAAMITLTVTGLVCLVAALLLPRQHAQIASAHGAG
jgi:hypothetical protein